MCFNNVLKIFITGKHVTALPVVRVMYAFNGEGRFSGCCPERTPGRIEMAFGVGDYVRHGTPHANFGGDRFSGGGWANTPFVPLVYVFFTSYFFLTPSVRLQPRPLNRFRRLMAQTTRFPLKTPNFRPSQCISNGKHFSRQDKNQLNHCRY